MTSTNKELLQQIGSRLAEERAKLKFSSKDIYSDELISLPKATYESYEDGRREVPGTVLYRLWHMGFDIQYIVTGEYSEY